MTGRARKGCGNCWNARASKPGARATGCSYPSTCPSSRITRTSTSRGCPSCGAWGSSSSWGPNSSHRVLFHSRLKSRDFHGLESLHPEDPGLPQERHPLLRHHDPVKGPGRVEARHRPGLRALHQERSGPRQNRGRGKQGLHFRRGPRLQTARRLRPRAETRQAAGQNPVHQLRPRIREGLDLHARRRHRPRRARAHRGRPARNGGNGQGRHRLGGKMRRQSHRPGLRCRTRLTAGPRKTQGIRRVLARQLRERGMTLIGIIGGSGLYDPELLENKKTVNAKTPYGKPSDKITTGTIQGVKVAFLPRHGHKHTLNPSNVPYRANIWALKKLGCTRILSPCAVGSLQEDIEPGTLVFPDQFIDRTYKRETTFHDAKKGSPQGVCHVSVAEPFCNDLRFRLVDAAIRLGIPYRRDGTYACIEGPRFSTKAESRLYRGWGAHLIGMTLVPEVVLAREAEMCYASIAMITDYDTFKEQPVTPEEILSPMKANVEKVKKLLLDAITKIPAEREKCGCGNALKGALI